MRHPVRFRGRKNPNLNCGKDDRDDLPLEEDDKRGGGTGEPPNNQSVSQSFNHFPERNPMLAYDVSWAVKQNSFQSTGMAVNAKTQILSAFI